MNGRGFEQEHFLPSARRELMRRVEEMGVDISFFGEEDVKAYRSETGETSDKKLEFETDDSGTKARAQRDSIESALGVHQIEQEALIVNRRIQLPGDNPNAA